MNIRKKVGVCYFIQIGNDITEILFVGEMFDPSPTDAQTCFESWLLENTSGDQDYYRSASKVNIITF